MIELSTLNSRMKDFYDIYNLLKSVRINLQLLQEAVRAIFKNRQTEYTENHALFAYDFTIDENHKKMWNAFLNKINIESRPEINKVMQKITNTLKPIWDKLK